MTAKEFVKLKLSYTMQSVLRAPHSQKLDGENTIQYYFRPTLDGLERRKLVEHVHYAGGIWGTPTATLTALGLEVREFLNK